jgi:hypothetical protein
MALKVRVQVLAHWFLLLVVVQDLEQHKQTDSPILVVVAVAVETHLQPSLGLLVLELILVSMVAHQTLLTVLMGQAVVEYQP